VDESVFDPTLVLMVKNAMRSQVRQNAEKDPSYCPYCLRCPGLVRMEKIEPFLWRCWCGAIHDERNPK